MPSTGRPAATALPSQALVRSLHSCRSVTIAAEPLTTTPAKASKPGSSPPDATSMTTASSRSNPAATRIQWSKPPWRRSSAAGWPATRIRNGDTDGDAKVLPAWGGMNGVAPYTTGLPAPADDHGRSPRRRHCPADLPAADPAPERLLGGAGLRADPATRPGGRCRHLPSGHLPALARAGAMECRLRAALPPSDRRPLRREPQPPAALLPVPGGDEAQPRQHRRAVLRLAQGARRGSAGARPAPGRGQLGIAHPGRLGTGLGGLAQRHGGDPVHLVPAGRR